MQNLFMKFVLPLVIFSFLTIKAEAALDYNTAYMVTAENSTTLSLNAAGEYEYRTSETPWVYLKLKFEDLTLTAPLHVLWSWSSFTDPSINQTKLEHISLAGLNGDKELWSAVPEPWWSGNDEHGKWTVDVAWLNAQGAMGTSTATFNVTPEPISSALFLFGGVPLAAALLRKKKTANGLPTNA